MSTPLGDTAILHHQDLIRVLDGSQPVGDGEDRLPLGQGGQGLLDQVLVLRVHAGGGLVQDDDGRVLQNGPGDGDALTLSAGELLTRVPGGGVPAVLQTADKLLALGCPGGGEYLLIRGPRSAQPDVLLQGAVKEKVVLGDEADLPGELLQGQFPDCLLYTSPSPRDA
mgnify:CR=1 FL=1